MLAERNSLIGTSSSSQNGLVSTNFITGTSTVALTQISYQIPIMNSVTQTMQYSSQWKNTSLTEGINKFALNAKPVEISKGKVIYGNNEIEVSVVYDKNKDIKIG